MSVIDICDELHQNFVDFTYEANSQRAFPDARDGLKPGQRACLWEMYTKGYTSNKAHVKSAKISGGTIATWWPHGDTAMYETFARMSQPWINNIPEIDWHGSNGNVVIGAQPASSRYTEARLSKAVEDGMLQGLKKKNVDMILNFSEDEEWPEALPAIFPRLLVNGCQGIGVTLANTWIPMNLQEVSNGIINYIQTNEIDLTSINPDFPSGGVIINKDELSVINETGKGKVVLRGKVDIEDNTILISELPYQVYVEPFIDSIKDLIVSEELKGIKNIYNKSDKRRLLIEIECDKITAPLQVLNKLYKATELQKTYNANQWALVGKTPQLLTLKDYFDIYIDHNSSCIRREAIFDLNKARARKEIVEGLVKALEDIDNIINLIKKSNSADDAKHDLMAAYGFTWNQALSIVDMKLGKLAHLEKVELNEELQDLIETIKDLTSFLNSEQSIKNELIQRLKTFTDKYSIPRKTQLLNVTIPSSKEEKEIEDVEPEQCVIVMTESGYIKRVASSSFKTQKKNGKGIKTQDDITSAIIRTNTIDSLMIFSNKGVLYRLLVNDIPEGTNTTKGQHIKSLIQMEADEVPSTIYSIYRDTDLKYVFFATKDGLVKKTPLEDYTKTRKKSGLSAIKLNKNDDLAAVSLIKNEQILLITHLGQCIRFDSTDITSTSRTSGGVKGIGLKDGDYVVAALPIRDENDDLALFSENGLGKRIALTEFTPQKRGGKGVIAYKPKNSTGNISCATLVSDDDNILICGDTNSICISAKDISQQSRVSIGTALIKTNKLLSVSKV